MSFIVLVIHVLAALGVIGLVLMQHGKGADMGAAFGGGSSGSLFGSSGSANFLSRLTAIFTAIFFITSMSLSYLQFEESRSVGVMSGATITSPATVPSAVEELDSVVEDGEGSKVDEIPK
ncbi:MAG: preprotein translocase subunit SecG [Proteobacteria bacterium]|nr:preprotein translocase subunit SecG [Pseudomonadota bacterium]MDA1331667.1 preprotein translocase subunit SecG [Pseudomonadota bacterium]